MFTDEIYEEVLINQHGKITNAHVRVCKEKLDPKSSIHQDIQRIENGYQLSRKRHPEFAEDSFRRFFQEILLRPVVRSWPVPSSCKI